MAHIELTPEESLVLIEFLLRFSDEERLAIEHQAEERILWNLGAALESQVPELLAPDYQSRLEAARAALAREA